MTWPAPTMERTMANEHRLENDSVERALDIFGDRWTFMILREAFFGVRRYGELAQNLGLSRTILSDRLKTLVEHGVLERRRYLEQPERHEYVLTKAGLGLYPAIVCIMRWGDQHLSGPEGPPLVLRHTLCGHNADPRLVCGHCAAELEAREVQPEPGPGAFGKRRAPTRR